MPNDNYAASNRRQPPVKPYDQPFGFVPGTSALRRLRHMFRRHSSSEYRYPQMLSFIPHELPGAHSRRRYALPHLPNHRGHSSERAHLQKRILSTTDSIQPKTHQSCRRQKAPGEPCPPSQTKNQTSGFQYRARSHWSRTAQSQPLAQSCATLAIALYIGDPSPPIARQSNPIRIREPSESDCSDA